jgi:spore germination protein YaaH
VISTARRVSLITVAGVLLFGVSLGGQETSPLRVGAWVTYWDQDRGFERLEAAPEAVHDVFFFAGALTENGGLLLNGDTTLLQDAIRRIRRGGGRPWLTIVNDVHHTNGERARLKDRTVVHRMLSDKDRRRQHCSAIVELAGRLGVSGVDIDYENLDYEDRDGFTTFIKELAAELDAQGLSLSVTVQSKTRPSRSRGPGAADWEGLCRSARLQIMLYNLHSGRTEPGPIATPAWIKDVLRYAGTQCPQERIVPVLKLIGIDWSGDASRSALYAEATSRAREHGVTIERDGESDAPFFRYTAPDGDHTVYFEDAESIERKLDVIRSMGLTAVVFWRLGGEDPALLPRLEKP